MASTATADKTEQPKPANGKKKKMMIMAVGLCLLLAAGGGGAWYFLKGNAQSNGKKAGKEAHKSAPVFVNFDQFTVNLQDDGGDRFLQTEIILEVSGNKVVEPIKERMPILRSAILLLLSSKVSADLSSKSGKNKLAEQIMAEIRKHLNSSEPGKGIEGIHFASFVIQ